MSPWLLASVQLEPPLCVDLRCPVPCSTPFLCPFVSLRSLSSSGLNASTRRSPCSRPLHLLCLLPATFTETGIKMMFAWKPKALPTLSSEVRRITLPFIRPLFHNICFLNFQERHLRDFLSIFLFLSLFACSFVDSNFSAKLRNFILAFRSNPRPLFLLTIVSMTECTLLVR